MSKNRNYVPSSDGGLHDWAKNLLEYAAEPENYTRWRISEPGDPIFNVLDDFAAKYEACKSPNRTPVEVTAKNVAKEKLVKDLRNYVQGFLIRNVNVTAEDRVLMSLPLRDVIPTNVPPPVTQAEGTLAFRGVGLVEMRNIRPSTEKPDARAGYGVRIYYGIMGTPSETNRFRIAERPKTGDDLPHSVFTRKKQHLFDFAGENGQEVFFCMRYENSKGQPGPWGKIISAFIP